MLEKSGPSTAMTSSSCAPAPARLLACLWLVGVVSASLLPMVTARVVPGDKRSATGDAALAVADYPDYQSGIRYDEYPVVVPKRTALLLDKVMVALQKAMDDDPSAIPARIDMSDKMDLQRRGQPKGRVYWRCYFNAVTCFKRK